MSEQGAEKNMLQAFNKKKEGRKKFEIDYMVGWWKEFQTTNLL